MELLKKVLKYLKKISDFGIIYVRYGDNSFSVYTDSNYNKRILFNDKDLQISKRKNNNIRIESFPSRRLNIIIVKATALCDDFND